MLQRAATAQGPLAPLRCLLLPTPSARGRGTGPLPCPQQWACLPAGGPLRAGQQSRSRPWCAGRLLSTRPAGRAVLTLPLAGHRSRLLWRQPSRLLVERHCPAQTVAAAFSRAWKERQVGPTTCILRGLSLCSPPGCLAVSVCSGCLTPSSSAQLVASSSGHADCLSCCPVLPVMADPLTRSPTGALPKCAHSSLPWLVSLTGSRFCQVQSQGFGLSGLHHQIDLFWWAEQGHLRSHLLQNSCCRGRCQGPDALHQGTYVEPCTANLHPSRLLPTPAPHPACRGHLPRH